MGRAAWSLVNQEDLNLISKEKKKKPLMLSGIHISFWRAYFLFCSLNLLKIVIITSLKGRKGERERKKKERKKARHNPSAMEMETDRSLELTGQPGLLDKLQVSERPVSKKKKGGGVPERYAQGLESQSKQAITQVWRYIAIIPVLGKKQWESEVPGYPQLHNLRLAWAI